MSAGPLRLRGGRRPLLALLIPLAMGLWGCQARPHPRWREWVEQGKVGGGSAQALVLEERLRKNPKDLEAAYELARRYAEQGRRQDARAVLLEAARRAPEAPRPYYELTTLALNEGLLEEALQHAQEALARAPQNPMSHYYLAQVYTARQEEGPAEQAWRAFAEGLPPEVPEGYLMLGDFYMRFEKRAKAEEAYAEAVRRQPSLAQGWLGLFQAQLQQGKISQARKTAEAFAQHFPDSPKAARLRGLVALQEGRWHEALQQANRLLAQSPGDVDGLRLQGKALVGLKRWKEAEGALRAAVRRSPQEAELWYHLALALEGQGRWREAVEAYREAVEADINMQEAHNNLAWALLEAGGSLDEALAHAEYAYRLDPENPIILDTLGWMLHRRGQREEALAYLQQAAQKAPQDAEIRRHLQEVQRASPR